jgi:hypothetical protein
MDASSSKALRVIGLSIAPLAVPTLIEALKRSDAWNSLVLVDNLLYFALEGGIISGEMSVDDLTPLQREALEALVERKQAWVWGNMDFVVGRFFSSKYGSSISIWDREDVRAFLNGPSSSLA